MTNNDLLQKITDLEMRVEQLEIVRHPNKSGLDMNPSAIWTPKPLKQSLFIKAFKAALESPHKNPHPYNERWLDGYTYTNVYLKQAFSETYQQWKA